MRRRSFVLSSLALTTAGLSVPALAVPPSPNAPAAHPRPGDDRAAAARRVLARLERLRVEDDYAGVVRLDLAGSPLVFQGVGIADPTAGRAFDRDTQVETASIGKMFTAVAALKLQDQGRLNTDDLISRFLPDVPEDKQGVRIFNLLTGSSGLPPSPPVFGGLTREAMERRVLGMPLRAAPGERFIYSNVAFNLMAAIVERVAERPFEDFLLEEVLRPGGAVRTGYAGVYDPDRAASGRGGRPLLQAAWGADRPDWNVIGAGGLLSTADDMMAWDRAFLAGRIVSPAAVTAVTTGWIDQGPNAPPGKYGFGRGVQDHPVRGRTLWHNGGDQAFTAYYAAFPDHDGAIFVASNTRADATQSGLRLLRALFGEADPTPPQPQPQRS